MGMFDKTKISILTCKVSDDRSKGHCNFLVEDGEGRRQAKVEISRDRENNVQHEIEPFTPGSSFTEQETNTMTNMALKQLLPRRIKRR